jgi:hypothetical protein
MIRTVIIAGNISAQGLLVAELANGRATVDIGGGEWRTGVLVPSVRR